MEVLTLFTLISTASGARMLERSFRPFGVARGPRRCSMTRIQTSGGSSRWDAAMASI